jgi:hypothetical protein
VAGGEGIPEGEYFDEVDMSDFDWKRARSLIGKHVIIGLTYYDHNETLLEQVQLHGDIVRFDEEGAVINLSGTGEEFTLPPDPSAFVEAAPGEYRLRSTGERVVNPDLTTSWTIEKPPPKYDA